MPQVVSGLEPSLVMHGMFTVADSLRTMAHRPFQPLHPHPIRVDMSTVCSIILGGGQGTRLFPLTHTCCKPGIIFGGRYRLIDIAISNALHSHIKKNFVITQFLASSLQRHIHQTYRSERGVEVLGVEEKPGKAAWFQGTADAVRQNIEYLSETPAEFFLILSGDQLYHLNFQEMVAYAIEKEVDVVVATKATHERDARRMGIMKVNEDQRIVDFYEKPNDPTILSRFAIPPSVREKMGLASSERHFLGSMGIYLFRRSALFDLLTNNEGHDFGKHLIPAKVKLGSIASFPHSGYWEDIGTIESFYRANLALTQRDPPFDLYAESHPIATRSHDLPGAKISCAQLRNSIVCEGCVIDAEEISGSLIGQRMVIGAGSVIRDSYLIGNDAYFSHAKDETHAFRIESGCVVQKAIIDKNVHIGKNVHLTNKDGLTEYSSQNAYIRDGIIIIPNGATLPDGFSL